MADPIITPDVEIHSCPDETAKRIREYLRSHPDLRDAEYRDDAETLAGHCYVASETYFHAAGGRDRFMPERLTWDSGATHWWLRELATDAVFDLILADDPPVPPYVPYADGRGAAFLTGYEQPSERAEQVLNALDIDH